MGIKLTIEAETPLDDDDRDILAGLSVMILAVANRRNLADMMDEETDEETDEEAEPPVKGMN